MSKTTKEMISDYITDNTKKFDLMHFDKFTTVAIAEELHISRSIASQYLNELCEEKKIFKVKSRPVYFFGLSILEKKYHVSLSDKEFLDMDDMVDFLRKYGSSSEVFSSLVGYDGSLKKIIKRCNEVFNYPPNGLSFVIYGNDGSGKKTLADLVCKNSRMTNGVVKNDTKIIKKNLRDSDPLIADKLQTLINEKSGQSIVFIVSHFEKINEQLSLYLEKFFEKGTNKNIHFIFLANKRPDDFLKPSLTKYIPVAVHLKNFDEKPKEEKEGIIISLFSREALQLGKDIKICSNVLKALSKQQYERNIDQLAKTIKLICAQAINPELKEIIVHTYDLPEEILEDIEISTPVFRQSTRKIPVCLC